MREITKYLSHAQLKSVRKTCKFIKNAVDDIFANKSYVDIWYPEEFDKIKILHTLAVKKIMFRNMHPKYIKECDILKVLEDVQSNKVSSIVLRKCQIDEDYLFKFLDAFPSLKELEVEMIPEGVNYIKLLYSTACRLETIMLEHGTPSNILHEDETELYALPDSTITLKTLCIRFDYNTIGFLGKRNVKQFFNCIRGSLQSLTVQMENFKHEEMDWLVEMNFNYLKEICIIIDGSLEGISILMDFMHMIGGRELSSYDKASQKTVDELMYKHLEKLTIDMEEYEDKNEIFGTIDLSRLTDLKVGIFLNN